MWVSGYRAWNENEMDVRRQRALHSHPHTAAAKATLSLFCPRRPACKTLFFFLVLRMLLQLLLALLSSLSERGDTTRNPAALWVLGEEDSTWDALRRAVFLSSQLCQVASNVRHWESWCSEGDHKQCDMEDIYRITITKYLEYRAQFFFLIGTQELIHQEQWDKMFRRFSINNIQVA